MEYSFDPEQIGDAHAILARYGTSYAWATRLLPREVRDDVALLYAWVRYPDELVDNPPEGQDGSRALQNWQQRWNEVYGGAEKGKTASDSLAAATARLFHRVGMPEEYPRAFLQAMEQDLTVNRYKTYEELRSYMYGSAAVVGRMMLHVLGAEKITKDGPIVSGADALGYAMQLTNFWRDVGEDYRQRGRIYLPQEDMKKFGVTNEQVGRGVVTDEFRQLMRFEIARARELYRQAEQAIPLLPAGSRFSIRVASRLYAAILDEIERNGYDVFSRRARTGWLRKLCLTVQAYTLTNRN